MTLTLGRSLNASSIREGVDAYLECSVQANPPVRLVSWKHSVSFGKIIEFFILGAKIPVIFFFLRNKLAYHTLSRVKAPY